MNTCPNDKSKLIAQTVFLGASVSSFNCNLGWSGQPSQVTVNLVEDISTARPDDTFTACDFSQQFATPVNSYSDNHYYDCSNDDCYVDRDGSAWAKGQIGKTRQDGSIIYADDKLVPGKVYYHFSNSNDYLDPVVSRYWLYPDPGFLGTPNRINTDGSVSYSATPVNSGYDIIGVPVYFKMGNFSFGGIVQSWEENLNSGGKQYKVVIDGFQSVLSNCFVIVGEYGGSIFSRYSNTSNYGMPRNYIGNLTTHFGSISQGNMPNVFNVYGFLESTAPENFGGSNTNDDGMSAKEILGALRILTSSATGGTFGDANKLADRAKIDNNDFAPKTAYSPFGRILVKKPQLYYSHNPITTSFKDWGIVPVTTNAENGGEFCEFLLDLSEVVNPPDDFRIKGPVVSILQLINDITEATGYDYTVELIPVNDTASSKTYNVIKIKTISRLVQPTPNQIKNTANQLLADGYSVSSNTRGKERNESPARCAIIGGKQQRLYQAKSYRLAYTQSNFIFDTYNRKFVDYTGLGNITASVGTGGNSLSRSSAVGGKNFGYGKIKFPSFYSTRNIELNNIINPDSSSITLDEENVKIGITSVGFNTSDDVWTDGEITHPNDTIINKKAGNYDKAKKGDYPSVGDWGIKSRSSVDGLNINNSKFGGSNTVPAERYFPLYKDVICPFFGYLMDNEYDIDTTKSTNSADFRRIRPVYFDTWTGQICVLFRASELPATRIELEGLYGGFSGLSRNAMPFTWNPVTPQPAANTLSPTSSSSSPSASSPGVSPTNSSTTTYTHAQKREWFFMVTESEFRAAMEGEENFIAYSLVKTYKTDLYLMLNQAYITKQYEENKAGGYDNTTAYRMAENQCNWHWSQNESIIVNATFTPEPTVPDKSEGLKHVEEEARKDFETIAKFLRSVGEKFYGKKYMVQAPYVGARRDMSFADIAIPTEAGYAYVFRGNNKIKFNYEPTNEGAWEEYGNIIDDSVAVGSKDWHSLTNEIGLIQPIVGYNVTDNFDRVRYNTCRTAISDANFDKQINPYFHYSAWAERKVNKNGSCNPIDFIFPSIDLHTISDPTKYVVVECKKPSSSANGVIVRTFPVNNNDLLGADIFQIDAFGNAGFPRKKLYHVTEVDEKMAFIDPEQLTGPRIIIDAPGIFLNNSSESFQKDPNKTIKANIAVEDAAIYLRANHPGSWDIAFLNLMSSYIENVNPEGLFIGDYSKISQNTTANNITMKQKVAHPFFVGIPIKSNQFTYGPWTNYPYADASIDNIFPNGQDIQVNIETLSTTTGNIIYGDADIKRAIDNWILPTKVEVNPDFVPWNYGGMAYLDKIAYNEVKSKINYQNILETATVEMPGLPLFNLGGAFNSQAINNQLPISGLYFNQFSVKEVKRTASPILSTQSIVGFNELNNINNLVYTDGKLIYRTINLPYKQDFLSGPIISTIGIDVGQNGIKTTYMFRTYSRKLSLFNKEYADKIKRFTKDNLSRDKQAAKINQQIVNRINNDKATMVDQRDHNADLQSASSKLLGWSPVEVIVATASPFLKEPARSPERIEYYNSSTMPTGQTSAPSSITYSLATDNDIGTSGGSIDDGFNYSDTQIPTLYNKARVRTTAQIYQISELNDFVKQDYGSKAVMSLDGIFSPISFYPTNNLSTFSFSKYQTANCPVCSGTKLRSIDWKKFSSGADTVTGTGTYSMVCDSCCSSDKKLGSSLDFSTSTKTKYGESIPPYIITSGSDLSAINSFAKRANTIKGTPGQNIPINLVSLQPLIMPYSEFKNPNIQNYTGVHPDQKHEALTIKGRNRNFIDRSRHSISIVGRSAVPQNSLQIYSNLDDPKYKLNYPRGTTDSYNSDYFYKDIKAIENLKTLGNKDVDYELNQRFIGLRGPIVVHGWGYDQEGFPVPNAADEPLYLDEYARPFRFDVIRTIESATTYEKLAVGDVFTLTDTGESHTEMIKSLNLSIQNTLGNRYGTSSISNSTTVYPVKYKDDYNSPGGFLNKGSIISKTQKFINNKWTVKQKLKEFYLNWGERPDLWPVGPVDLRWDESRKIWTNNAQATFKMMYVTLEEDLTRNKDTDETHPTRGFLDDVEFSSQPMPNGTRRLVFVKDRCGYTAPRGAKLLCRYDADSGFYEPVSKPSFIVKGTITTGSNQANIEMSYLQGRQSGEAYTSMLVNFDNPFALPTSNGVGLFTYINGKWTLTTSK